MKKLILIIGMLVIITSCSNPEYTKKIEEQRIFENNIKCSDVYFSGMSDYIKQVKYSEKLNSCILLIKAGDYYIRNTSTGEKLYECSVKNDNEAVTCEGSAYSKFKNY